jgi:hypothetical protein
MLPTLIAPTRSGSIFYLADAKWPGHHSNKSPLQSRPLKMYILAILKQEARLSAYSVPFAT